jgi:hypothetical protein
MMKIEIIIIVILLACSCTQKGRKPNEKSGDIRKIDVIFRPDSIIYNLSDIASDIQYIPLHTPVILQFAYIYKVITSQHSIFINSGDNLFCYDDSGRFLYSLFKNDKESPGFINDFDISTDQKTIAVLYYRKILLFEVRDAKLVYTKSIKLNKPSPCKISFIPETNNILLSMNPRKGTEKSLSLIINCAGDTLELKKNHPKYFLPSMPVFESGTIQYKSGKAVFFKEQNNDTIFYINEKSEITPSYILDLKGKTILNWTKGSGEYQYDRMNPYIIIEDIFEVPKFILYTYSHHYPQNARYALYHKIVYNKITGRKLHVNINKDLKNDLCGGPDFYPLFVSGDKYYSWSYGSDLRNWIESEAFNKTKIQNQVQKDFLKNLANSLKDRDIVLIAASPK